MGELTYCEKTNAWLRNSKSYLLIISLQFGSAGMYVLTMDALNKGMSHYIFVVYRNVIATIALAPFAFFLERYFLDYKYQLSFMHICMLPIHAYNIERKKFIVVFDQNIFNMNYLQTLKINFNIIIYTCSPFFLY
jgi:hypothetical protein